MDSSIERPTFFLSIKWIRYVQNVPCTNHFNYETATFSWSFRVDSAGLGIVVLWAEIFWKKNRDKKGH